MLGDMPQLFLTPFLVMLFMLVCIGGALYIARRLTEWRAKQKDDQSEQSQ